MILPDGGLGHVRAHLGRASTSTHAGPGYEELHRRPRSISPTSSSATRATTTTSPTTRCTSSTSRPACRSRSISATATSTTRSKKLDKYWANDTRAHRAQPALRDDRRDPARRDHARRPSCPSTTRTSTARSTCPTSTIRTSAPAPDPVCDNAAEPDVRHARLRETRRTRDRCIADHLLTLYERETDTLVLRPVLPLDEMTRYAVVITDRLVDGKGNAGAARPSTSSTTRRRRPRRAAREARSSNDSSARRLLRRPRRHRPRSRRLHLELHHAADGRRHEAPARRALRHRARSRAGPSSTRPSSS